MNTRIMTPTPDITSPSKPQPIPGQGRSHLGPPRVFTTENDGFSSDEERTHISVLSRRSRKRRRTTTSFDGASNPSREVVASLAGSCGGGLSPYPPTAFPHSPPLFENCGPFDDADDDHMLRKRKSISLPDSDIAARQRCYEYLHSAIDAVWAEYCDSTSYAERQKYMPHSPVSEAEDPLLGGFGSSSGESWIDQPRAKSLQEPSPSACRGKARSRSCSSGSASGGGDSISLQPQSQSLMRQKNKLLDAKYYLGYIVLSTDPHDSARFWRTWDQLKYSTVELVEGDDDEADEVIEDLEAGRF